MSTEVTLPVLGENVDSGTVVKILVSVGDKVTTDQPVLDLDTDKASVEVPASASGTVKEIRVKEGDTVRVGQVLFTLEEARTEEAQPEPEPRPEEAPRQPEAEKELKETAEEQEREKPAHEAPAGAERDSRKPQEMRAASSEAKPEERRPPRREPEVVRFPKQEPEPSREVVPAGPNVRRIARELGIDINEVTGTGPDGRISEADIRNYARSIILNSTVRRTALRAAAAELPDFTRWGEVERQPMNGVRRKTAEHVTLAWTSIPHVTHFDSVDITETEQLREGFARKVEEAGGKLTITAIAIKIIAAALRMFPQFNATVDLEHEEIIYKKYYNIGVAVDTERGLLVPVVRDTDKKNVLELSVELTRLAEKARNRKLTAEDMQGGTFTITNVGAIGGIGFTPIINAPEVAILGIARAKHEAVFRDGQIQSRLMLPLALSFDHRVIDGADAARFLRWVAGALEQPFRLTLEG
jgi:pyruvate dehydrogenase E2 component (dihydrolipoyllysine-residue acetyltransferase)